MMTSITALSSRALATFLVNNMATKPMLQVSRHGISYFHHVLITAVSRHPSRPTDPPTTFSNDQISPNDTLVETSLQSIRGYRWWYPRKIGRASCRERV